MTDFDLIVGHEYEVVNQFGVARQLKFYGFRAGKDGKGVPYLIFTDSASTFYRAQAELVVHPRKGRIKIVIRTDDSGWNLQEILVEEKESYWSL